MAETLSGRQEPTPSSSLDTKSISARKKSRRAFQRVMSGLVLDGSYRFVTLTTSDESANKAFQQHFRCLMMRLRRRGLVKAYIRVGEMTKSGLYHQHIVFRGEYIEQVYLSYLWEKLHHAPIVDIRRVKQGRQTAGYLAKYCSKENSGRLSWSWSWVYRGFCRDWQRWKRICRATGKSYGEMVRGWSVGLRIGLDYLHETIKNLTQYYFLVYDDG